MTRTDITRLREKARSDRAALDALLDWCRLGHFGFVRDGAPVVIPTAGRPRRRSGARPRLDRFALDPYPRRRWVPTCLAADRLGRAGGGSLGVRVLDPLPQHGAVRFVHTRRGRRARPRPDHRGAAAGAGGRTAPAERSERAATLVLQLPISEWSLKVSAGWPEDPPEDVAGEAWAGVVPRDTSYGEPVPAPDLRDGIPVPESVRNLRREP